MSEQLSLLEPTDLVVPPDVPIWLACPSCGHVWHAATLAPGAWWMVGLSVHGVAGQCYCARCQQAPPMVMVDASEVDTRLQEASC